MRDRKKAYSDEGLENWSKYSLLCVLLFCLLPLNGCRTPQSLARGLDVNNNPFNTIARAQNPLQQSNRSTAQSSAFSYGVVFGPKGANVRQGPGTGYRIVGSLASGTNVKILNERNNWYNVEGVNSGRTMVGWIYAPLVQASKVGISGVLHEPVANSRPTSSNIIYMGYTRDFLPMKQLLASGRQEELAARLSAAKTGNEALWKQDDEFLRSVEYGTIMLDRNETSDAIKDFSIAEKINEERESGSLLGEWAGTGSGWLGEVLGHGALAPYEGEGYEKVLMLNYLSIAYLLEGQRKAYNVARRSIDWQNMEKKAFDARRNKAQEKLREQNSNQADERDSYSGAQGGISAVFDAFNSKAKNVPSAFVNPFGFYVTGMIQEFESFQDRSLRDNARISYEKALELNPSSAVLQQAVEDLKNSAPPEGKHLLHVVVADGFVPEKKVLSYDFYFNGSKIPMKIPIYQPGDSRVARIEIQTTRGRRLARLSPVADVEALCIRYQKDSEVFRNLKVALAFSSTAVEKTFLSQLGVFGNVLGEFHDQYREPDTRSWMTLPATIQAARTHLSGSIRKIKLVSYSSRGAVLASQIIELLPNKPNFIYARSIDTTLYAHSAQPLWLAESF